ncbi:hypothetical protein [Rhizohabitans arisaemae]|uniref:hypothetical protein n=1 Tax=Rhizohabitans arisaemae TaxID=2720610 RepID=UPI0024B0E613|nr:hypothetical protein [Rhizohabitans arisaemae]
MTASVFQVGSSMIALFVGGVRAMGNGKARPAGSAVGCLLVALVCELVIGISAFVRYLNLAREVRLRKESGGDEPLTYVTTTVESLPWFAWGYTVLGVITLALAAWAWRRGGTRGVRTAAALGLVPYMLVYVVLGLWGPAFMYSYSFDDFWWLDVSTVLAGTAALGHLAGTGLLLHTAPNRPGNGDAAVRRRGGLSAGWAVACLLATSACGLVIAAFSLVLMPSVRRRAADHEERLVVDNDAGRTLETLVAHSWLYAVVGVVALALAALVWRRGGTVGARIVLVMGVAPYTILLLLIPWEANPWLGDSFGDEHLGWYKDLPLWLAITALLSYVAGTILLLFTKAVRGDGPPRAAEPTGGSLSAGWAVACLLAASVCGLAVTACSLVLMPSARRRVADELAGLIVDYYARDVLDSLWDQLWVCAVVGAVAAALAALVWRRGGTPGVRAVVALVAAPYTTLPFFGLGELADLRLRYDPGVDYVGWYVDVSWWLVIGSVLCYLAGTTLLVFTEAARRGGLPRAAEPNGVAT